MHLYQLKTSCSDGSDPEPVAMQLTAKGKEAWISFYNEHAMEHAELTGDLSAAWLKLEGYTARFALVIQCVRLASCDTVACTSEMVDEHSIAAGAALSRWCGREAKRVYAMLAESDQDREHRRLAELIQRKGGSVSCRDWMRARSHRTAAEADRELDDLARAGYGTYGPAQQNGRGAPSKRFTLYHDKDHSDKNTDPGPVSTNMSVSEQSEEHQTISTS